MNTTTTTTEIDRQNRVIDALLKHCPDAECSTCARIVCPNGDSLHFHHDGCPSCAEGEPRISDAVQVKITSEHAFLNATASWQLRRRLGTLSIAMRDAAAPLEEECDGKRWDNILELLNEIENATEEMRCIIEDPERWQAGA